MSDDTKPGALSPADAAVVERIVDETVREVAELPDRTSPDDRPEMMLVTGDELASIVRDSIEEVMALVVAARAETADWSGNALASELSNVSLKMRLGETDALRDALATAERARDALVTYTRHRPDCRGTINAERCTCGLAALRAAGGAG